MKIFTADAGLPRDFKSNLRNLFAFAATPFPPSPTDPRILMSDWSHFQGDIDIGKHIAYGPPKFRGAIIRSGQGQYSSYDDTKFKQNVQMCEANDFPWMLYHVTLPIQSADSQVNHLYEILNDLKGPLPKWIWWDVQVSNNQTKKHVSDVVIDSILLTNQIIGIDNGVYSARWFTSGYMETQDWFSEIEWWIAQWLWPDQQDECPWPTVLPDLVDISQVMIHQTTSYADGKLVGIGSTRLDLDRWMWTEEQFNEIMGEESPPPPNGDLKEQVEKNKTDIARLTWEYMELEDRVDNIEEWITSYGDTTPTP